MMLSLLLEMLFLDGDFVLGDGCVGKDDGEGSGFSENLNSGPLDGDLGSVLLMGVNKGVPLGDDSTLLSVGEDLSLLITVEEEN